MKLNIFDAYNIRVRLCSSIIVLAPIIITLFLCFEELSTLLSSVVLMSVLLALANCLPIFQRRIYRGKIRVPNYAVQFLAPSDNTLDPVSKRRYYKILAEKEPTFCYLDKTNDSPEFSQYCESAVRYLREKTRKNTLVQEENINFGFYRALFSCKALGALLCASAAILAGVYSITRFGGIAEIPVSNYVAIVSDLLLFLFWIFGINRATLEDTAKQYAKSLLYAIDSL